jgi:hypothetical protein
MVEVMPGNVRQSTNCKHLSMAGRDLANGPTFQTFSLYEICNLLLFSSLGENFQNFHNLHLRFLRNFKKCDYISQPFI